MERKGGKVEKVRVYASKGNEDLTLCQVNEGVVGAPEGTRAFYLEVFTGSRTFAALRNRATREYHAGFRSVPGGGLVSQIPVEVRKRPKGEGVYTVWHDQNFPLKTNKISVWRVADDGHLSMAEVGVIYPDGKTPILHQEVHWQGQLYTLPKEGRMYGKPDQEEFGPFDPMRQIQDYEPFQRLVPQNLPLWDGEEEELDPPALQDPTQAGVGVVKLWSPFMGMGRGQGVVILSGHKEAFIRGSDVVPYGGSLLVPIELKRGQEVRFEGLVSDMGRTPRLAKWSVA